MLYTRLLEFDIDINDIFTADMKNTEKIYLDLYKKQFVTNVIEKITSSPDQIKKKYTYQETIELLINANDIEFNYERSINYKKYNDSLTSNNEIIFFLDINDYVKRDKKFMEIFMENFNSDICYLKQTKDIELFDYKNTIEYNERKNVIQYFFVNHQFKYYKYQFKKKKNTMFVHKFPNMNSKSYNFR